MGGKTILSIDGGGIRGVIPATVLAAIEERAEQPVARLFEVIAGTSTGGILALGLSCPGPDGEPQYKAAALVRLYREQGKRIFPHEFSGRLRQLFGPKYSDRGRRGVLRERFGESRLSDAVTDVFVTSYDLQGRQPFFFRSAASGSTGGPRDYRMVEAAMATSAAPTYFRPVRIPGAPGKQDLVLVDGGVFANNPTMCGFVDDSTANGVVEGTLIVSLGTGEALRRANPVYPSAKRWGLIGWAKRILGLVFDGVSEATSYEIESLLGKTRFLRFQVELAPEQEHMDDSHAKNVKALEGLARDLIAKRTVEIDALCVELLRRAGRPVPAPLGARFAAAGAAAPPVSPLLSED